MASTTSSPRSSASSIQIRERAAARAEAVARAAQHAARSESNSSTSSANARAEQIKFAQLRLEKARGPQEEWEIRREWGPALLLPPSQRVIESLRSGGASPEKGFSGSGMVSSSLSSLPPSMRLEDRPEFSYTAGVLSSFSLGLGTVEHADSVRLHLTA